MSTVFDSANPGRGPADDEVARLRVPPQSIEAEQSVLGGLLLDNGAWDRAADVVTESDFYRFEHRLIFGAIGALISANKPADVITVYEQLQMLGKGDDSGGLAYLNALAQSVPSAANMRRYAEIVRERAILRKLIAASDEIATQAFNPQGRAVAQILDEAEGRIFKIGEEGARTRQGFQSMDVLAVQLIDRVTELAENGAEDVTGVRSGFFDLDRNTAGLQPGDLIVLAARPSMGKAQPLDAPVRTLGGWKAMGALEVGDALASVDGRPSIVTGLYPQGVKPVWRISFSDGRSAECCDEHLWRVHCSHWRGPRVLATSRLRELLERRRYRDRLWIERADGQFGHRDELPVDPWRLGGLLGAGRPVDLARGRVAESAVALTVGDDGPATRRDGMQSSRAQGAAPDPWGAALQGLGLSGLGSQRLCIPRAYLEADRERRLALLRGLLHAEGQVEHRDRIRFLTTSPRLADDVTELVRSLGGWCRVRPQQARRTGTPLAGIANGAAWVCEGVLPEPHGAVPPSHEQAQAPAHPRRPQRQRRLTVRAIEPSREAECQCISVSHTSRLYVTSQDVVTHNTAFALNIAENVSVHEGLPVVVFSMEMGASQLALRMVGSQGRIDQQHLRTGRLSHDEWGRLTESVERLSKSSIFIDETPALSGAELRARARRQARQCGKLGLIVIDYLQLMSGSSSGDENRATELGEISRGLKALAKELQCPVIALSQLNRSVETRNDKRPMMSDLRECVTGETLVCLCDGTRVPIRELVGQTPRLHAVDAARKIVDASSDLVWRVGTKPVRRLALANGRVLRATAKHRVMCADGWKEMGEIGVGDRVAVARRLAEPAHESMPVSGSDLFWDPVVANEPDGEEEVFDLTVPGPACWLADGIVTHNSGAIEQDADVIMFIYRDDYYNKDSKEPGVAEIIIGKQRNGPVGTVKLTFLKHWTKFDNLAPDYQSAEY